MILISALFSSTNRIVSYLVIFSFSHCRLIVKSRGKLNFQGAFLELNWIWLRCTFLCRDSSLFIQILRALLRMQIKYWRRFYWQVKNRWGDFILKLCDFEFVLFSKRKNQILWADNFAFLKVELSRCGDFDNIL